MRRLALSTALLAMLLVADLARAQAPPATREATGEGQPPGLDVMYICPGGMNFSAAFSKDGELATLTLPGQADIELSRQRSGAGFAYGDSYYELRGRGREATLTAAGRSMRCHAAGRPGEPPRTYQGSNLTVTLFPDGVFRLREQSAGAEPVLDLGRWAQEVDGGARLVLRGGTAARRVYRETGGDRLIAEEGSGTELARAVAPDLIDGTFRLTGLYRDTQNGGLFAECLTGRTFTVTPVGAEADLERAWTEATPSREAQLYVEVLARFVDEEIQVDRFIGLKRDGACAPLAQRGASLHDTEWRLVELDGERPSFFDWRQRPTLSLDDQGRFAGSTGCNRVTGGYQLDPDGLRFQSPATTMMTCLPPTDEVQRRFLDALGAVRTAQIAGTTLDLMDASGKRRLRLEARGR